MVSYLIGVAVKILKALLIYIYIYIYIYRERERERERVCVCVFYELNTVSKSMYSFIHLILCQWCRLLRII